jgi:NitT/TauT family transport system ATP-binding protein
MSVLTGDISQMAIVAEHLNKVYSSVSGAVPALADVSMSVEKGSFVSVLGPSGCGKSTLMMIAAGLVSKSSGSIVTDGTEVSRPCTNTGVVFQQPVLLDWRTALENVLLQAETRKLDMEYAREHARELLASVGLAGFEDKLPSELSGGMRQRVAICRALLHEPSILLMDEPFGALDALTRDQMSLDLLRLVSRRKMSVLFITHSIPEAVFMSDKIIVMTPRPGSIDKVIDVDLPRPRALATRESPQFAAYVHEIQDMFLARGVLRES